MFYVNNVDDLINVINSEDVVFNIGRDKLYKEYKNNNVIIKDNNNDNVAIYNKVLNKVVVNSLYGNNNNYYRLKEYLTNCYTNKPAIVEFDKYITSEKQERDLIEEIVEYAAIEKLYGKVEENNKGNLYLTHKAFIMNDLKKQNVNKELINDTYIKEYTKNYFLKGNRLWLNLINSENIISFFEREGEDINCIVDNYIEQSEKDILAYIGTVKVIINEYINVVN